MDNPDQPLLNARRASRQSGNSTQMTPQQALFVQQITGFTGLPMELQTDVVRLVANGPNALAAFYEIRALRATNHQLQAVIDNDPLTRERYRILRQETAQARIQNARNEASNPASTRTADEIFAHHDVPQDNTLRQIAAERDIYAGTTAPDAIARHGVIDQNGINRLQAVQALLALEFAGAAPGETEKLGKADILRILGSAGAAQAMRAAVEQGPALLAMQFEGGDRLGKADFVRILGNDGAAQVVRALIQNEGRLRNVAKTIILVAASKRRGAAAAIIAL
jgi:hypothetical protein